MKVLCPRCNEEKPPSAFNKWKASMTRGRKDGLQTWCRACQSERHQQTRELRLPQMAAYGVEYREKNRGPIRKKARAYIENDREKFRERSRVYYENHRDEILAAAKKRRQQEPLKYWARGQVSIAIKNGTLIRPDKCPCGSDRKIEAHHHLGYDRPLDVLWLCRICHAKQHRKKD